MENQKLISKIKSKYILLHILNYIKDKNIHYKLFGYSNFYQERINIKKIYYKKNYLDKIFPYRSFLVQYNYKYNNNLNKQYNKCIIEKKLNKKELENIIYDVINEEEREEYYHKLISIDSPLFDLISKTKNFESNYVIYISQIIAAKLNLKKKYNKLFNELNNSNRNYSSICFEFNRKRKIYYLKRLNIDFNKIKRIYLKCYNSSYPSNNFEKFNDNNFFFENLFSINNIENNLIYLNIVCQCYLENDLFENINNFKSLKYLILEEFEFNNTFYIKLKDLKILSCLRCKNIQVSEEVNFKELKKYNVCSNNISNINIFEKLKMNNLEKLELSFNIILDINVLKNVKFENLKKIDLESNKISNINVLENVNFKELKKLYLCHNYISDITVLAKAKFEQLEILALNDNQISDINILEKVNFKKLNELYLYKNKISDITVLENVNFEKLKIVHFGDNQISDINILQNVNFKELKQLYFFHNNISDIKVLNKIRFEKLEFLELGCNKITNVDILQNINFINIKNFQKTYDNISDKKVLKLLRFGNLLIEF